MAVRLFGVEVYVLVFWSLLISSWKIGSRQFRLSKKSAGNKIVATSKPLAETNWMRERTRL